MKIIVLGTRGLPKIPGGVETHCEQLYSNLATHNGIGITVICRSSYVKKGNRLKYYNGIQLKTLYAPKSVFFEAIVHSFLAALYSIYKRPDVVHIHGIGPNLVTPMLRLFGIKVVMTHHGPDYERQKWKSIPKLILRLGEWSGVKFGNKIIVISENIAVMIGRKYNRGDLNLIPNGVANPISIISNQYLQTKNLKQGKYILAVGRFVPEKGFDYLIKAYRKSGIDKEYQLVIAGDADHQTDYSFRLKESAIREEVVLTGFIKGEPLAELFTNARLFILPSFYEGLPITLLEAMSYSIDILASDISANKEVKLSLDSYFKAGDEEDLANKIKSKIFNNMPCNEYNMEIYNWKNIARQTLKVYYSLSVPINI